MRIGVVGTGHLGMVTAGCLAEHFDVVVYDQHYDVRKTWDLISEPGIGALWNAGEKSGNLNVTFNRHNSVGSIPEVKAGLDDCDVVWICYDTPITDSVGDVETVVDKINTAIDMLSSGKIVLVSSQLPVGTVSKLSEKHPQLKFACQPENLRIGRGISGFKQPDRIVCGTNDSTTREVLQIIFSKFTDKIIWTTIESAEMVKHAINCYLAASVAFANELGKLCIRVGASPKDVERGMKSDSRIGQGAYVAYGYGPGQHLMRDINYLSEMSGGLFTAIKKSNEESGLG